MIDWVQNNIAWVLTALVVHFGVLGTVAYMILAERKVAAWAQDRYGPNRTGFGFGIIPVLKDWKAWGLGQSFADGLKMFTKEDYRSPSADRALFTLAPIIIMSVAVVSVAVIPWGGLVGATRTENITEAVRRGQSVPAAVADLVPGSRRLLSDIRVATQQIGTGDAPTLSGYQADGTPLINNPVFAPPTEFTRVTATWTEGWPLQIADLNIGVLFILSVLSLAVYGVAVGGYASNNKYSFLGGLRATANMVSYEIPLGLSVLTIVLMFGTLSLGDLVQLQAGYMADGWVPRWNVFAQPLTFVLFLICILAEANRAPFDTAECEQELVGGFHTEYSSMRFGLFFLAEYAGMITTSAVCVALFFGGWHLPYLDRFLPSVRYDAGFSATVFTSLWAALFSAGVFFGKTLMVVFVFMWVRWSIPRFRFDQILAVAWKLMIPVSLALLIATVACVWLTGGGTVDGLGGREALVFLLANVAVATGALAAGSFFTRPEAINQRVEVSGSRYTHTPLPARA